MNAETRLATMAKTVRTWVTQKFLLGDAAALAARLPRADRDQLILQLAASAEQRESSAILAASEQPALALELAERAVEVLAAALHAAPVEAARLPLAGDEKADLLRLQRAAEVAQAPRPTHNRAVTPADKRRTTSAWTAAKRAERLLLPLVQSSRRIAIWRVGRVAGVALVAIAALIWILPRHFGPGLLGVTASASYDQTIHAPALAVDRNPSTEWLLPTATLGTLEIRLRRQRLHTVRLRNSHNPPYDDRAARDFHIEGYAAGKLIHKVVGSFPRLEPAPAPVEIRFRTPAAIDTLKVVIDSYHKSGGGLAEISWD